MSKFRKLGTIILAVILAMTVVAGCKNDPDTNTPDSAAQAEVETSKVVADLGTTKIEYDPNKPFGIERPVQYSKDGEVNSQAWREFFEYRKIIMESNLVFKGTIVGFREYEFEWTCMFDDGTKYAPAINTVIEVKIDKIYHGTSPVEGDVIRVFYPRPQATVEETSIYLKMNGEYVFMTRIFDDEAIKWSNEYSPDYKLEYWKYADCTVYNSLFYRLFPVENGNVILFNEYFKDNQTVKKHIQSVESVKTDKMTPDRGFPKDYFVAVSLDVFEKEFFKVFENPEVLPTVLSNEKREEIQRELEEMERERKEREKQQ